MVEGREYSSRRAGRVLKVVIAITLLIMALACGEKNTYVPPPPPKVTVMSAHQKARHRLPGVHRQRRGLQHRAPEGPGGRLPGQGAVQGRRLRDQGAAAVSHPAGTVPGPAPEGRGQVLAEKAQLEHAQTEFVRYSAAGEGGRRGPDRRGPLALRAGLYAGWGHGRPGPGDPGQAEPELHPGHRPL